MSQKNKKRMSLVQSTAFWKSLGIVVRKRARATKRYRPNHDFSALRRLGVTQEAIDKVYAETLSYNDELLFKNYSRFFRKDIETVKTWTGTKTASAAFIKLFNIYHRNNLTEAKQRFQQLALIYEFYKKGEGQVFRGKIKSRPTIQNFTSKYLRSRLTASANTSDYIEKGSTMFGKELIIWLQKNTDGKKTDKFIKLSKHRNNLNVSLSMDSKKEYYIVKYSIEKFFNTFLETPSSKKSFVKFFNFLRKGKSFHFTLSGCTYLDSQFRVAISPSHNRIENIAELGVYKGKIAEDSQRLEHLTQIRLSHIDKTLSKPIFLSILTYRDGIYGALILHPDVKKLTTEQKRILYKDFLIDFGLPLNEFLEYDDLTKKVLYKLFLEATPSKKSKIELRSKKALEIYAALVADKLISSNTITEDVSRVCVNSSCGVYFKPVWDNRRYCSTCGDVLITGRSIENRSIPEGNICNFIQSKFSEGQVTIVPRRLLSRKILIAQVKYKDTTVEFIPLNKPLNDNQISLLKFRYPHAVIITTRDDRNELVIKNCQAINLWDLVENIYNSNAKIIKDFAVNSRVQALANMRNLCPVALSQVDNTGFYKKKNSEVTNLGAELFEADCSILFDYVFGNCLWLGAKNRGVSVPDGFTAFPMLGTKKGCFIWDGKFSEGKKLVIGEFTKNKKYIEEARLNKSIKDNGGLKGFVFISNNNFPISLVKKFLPLTKKKRLKITFIRSSQFKEITQHYRLNESLILNNSSARDQFINSMVDLLFSTVNNNKVEIIDDLRIAEIVTSNNAYFATLAAGLPLVN